MGRKFRVATQIAGFPATLLAGYRPPAHRLIAGSSKSGKTVCRTALHLPAVLCTGNPIVIFIIALCAYLNFNECFYYKSYLLFLQACLRKNQKLIVQRAAVPTDFPLFFNQTAFVRFVNHRNLFPCPNRQAAIRGIVTEKFSLVFPHIFLEHT